MREKLLTWGLPGALGAVGYGLYLAAGLPEWAGFPMILLGALMGSALITIWRVRKGGSLRRRPDQSAEP
jgi:hypothetical protein